MLSLVVTRVFGKQRGWRDERDLPIGCSWIGKGGMQAALEAWKGQEGVLFLEFLEKKSALPTGKFRIPDF